MKLKNAEIDLKGGTMSCVEGDEFTNCIIRNGIIESVNAGAKFFDCTVVEVTFRQNGGNDSFGNDSTLIVDEFTRNGIIK